MKPRKPRTRKSGQNIHIVVNSAGHYSLFSQLVSIVGLCVLVAVAAVVGWYNFGPDGAEDVRFIWKMIVTVARDEDEPPQKIGNHARPVIPVAREAPVPYNAAERFAYWLALRREHADDVKLRGNERQFNRLEPQDRQALEQRLRDWDGNLKAEFDRERREHPELEREIEKAVRMEEKRA